jgi:hypothetical protein
MPTGSKEGERGREEEKEEQGQSREEKSKGIASCVCVMCLVDGKPASILMLCFSCLHASVPCCSALASVSGPPSVPAGFGSSEVDGDCAKLMGGKGRRR